MFFFREGFRSAATAELWNFGQLLMLVSIRSLRLSIPLHGYDGHLGMRLWHQHAAISFRCHRQIRCLLQNYFACLQCASHVSLSLLLPHRLYDS
jgi:hypothetical protein